MNIPKMTVAAIITTAIKNRSRKNRILKLQKVLFNVSDSFFIYVL